MSCLARKGKLGNYWLDSGGTQLIDVALLSDAIQEDLQTLVARERIVSFIMKQISFEDIGESVGLYSLLLFSGYLNPAAVYGVGDIYQLSILNHEVQYIYRQWLLRWVSKKLQIGPNSYYSLVSPPYYLIESEIVQARMVALSILSFCCSE